MTFEHRDYMNRVLAIGPGTDHNDQPLVELWSRGEYGVNVPVRVPLDRVEEVVAGIRDAARQAAGQPAADEAHRPPCVDGDHCGEAAHCPPPSAAYVRLQAAAAKTNREMAGATLRAYKRIHQLASTATGPIDPSEILDALKDPEPDPARLLAALTDDTPAAGLAAPTNHNTETDRPVAVDSARVRIINHPGVLATADTEIAALLDEYRAAILDEYRAAILNSAAEAVQGSTAHIRYGSASDYADRHADLLRRLASGAES